MKNNNNKSGTNNGSQGKKATPAGIRNKTTINPNPPGSEGTGRTERPDPGHPHQHDVPVAK